MALTREEIFSAVSMNPLVDAQGSFRRPLTFGENRKLNMQFIHLAHEYSRKLDEAGFDILTAFEQELQLSHSKTGRELSDEEYAEFMTALYERVPELDTGKAFRKEVNHVIEFASPSRGPIETCALFNLLVREIRLLAKERKVSPVWHRSDINFSVLDRATGRQVLDHRECDPRAGYVCGLVAKTAANAIPVFIRRDRFEKIGMRHIDAGMTRIRALRLVPNSPRMETRLDHNPLAGQHMVASMGMLLGAIYLGLTEGAQRIEHLMGRMKMPEFHDRLYWFTDNLKTESPCFFFRELLNGAQVRKSKKWTFDVVQIINYNKPQFLQKEMGYETHGQLLEFLDSLRIEKQDERLILKWSDAAAIYMKPEFIAALENIEITHPVSRFYAYRMNNEAGTKTVEEALDKMEQSELIEVLLGAKLLKDIVIEIGSVFEQQRPWRNAISVPGAPPQSRRSGNDVAAP